MSTDPILTRADYMAALVTHSEYYAQFVTEATRRHVTQRFSADELTEALTKDKHLNSIALQHWDRLTWHPVDPTQRWSAGFNDRFYSSIPYDEQVVKRVGEISSRAVLVCIAKEAARQIVDRHTQNQKI